MPVFTHITYKLRFWWLLKIDALFASKASTNYAKDRNLRSLESTWS